MDTKELLNFKTVCEFNSISEAARKLFITPQGLGKSIQHLERELNTKLLIRTPRGIELTEDGIALKSKADVLIKELENLQKDFELNRSEKRGKIHLASAYGIIRYYSPQCIIAFKKKYPRIDFSYEEYPDVIIDQMVENTDADIGLAVEPVDGRKFEKIALKTFTPLLLVGREHPLAHKKQISYEDINSLNMVIESGKFKINQIFTDKCRAHHAAPNILFETSGFSLCHKLCKANDCASVTLDFITEDMTDANLMTIPFEDKDFIWSFCFIWKKDSILSETGRLFLDFILEWNEKLK
ncbi:MAG: LysR family transcriptional regulator [Oscillospiraceae bacterium]